MGVVVIDTMNVEVLLSYDVFVGCLHRPRLEETMLPRMGWLKMTSAFAFNVSEIEVFGSEDANDESAIREKVRSASTLFELIFLTAELTPKSPAIDSLKLAVVTLLP